MLNNISDNIEQCWQQGAAKHCSILLNCKLKVLIKAKIILDLPMYASSTDALRTLKFKPLDERRFYHRCLLVHKIKNKQIDYKFDLTNNSDVHQYNTRRKNDFHLKKAKTNWGRQTFS